MTPILLTTLLFAVTVTFARRSAVLLGSTLANACRLLLAAALLGACSWIAGRGQGLASGWFVLSGVAGFGLGGLAMFHALPRAGSSLSTLIVQCGSAVTALVLERAWLGTRLDAVQTVAIGAIVVGVALGLAPRSWPALSRRQLAIGTQMALLSAFGQGLGAVCSRKAFAAARVLGGAGSVDAVTAAFERVVGGVLVAGAALAVAWVVSRRMSGSRSVEPAVAGGGLTMAGASLPVRGSGRANARAWPWVVANTLAGPVLGVTCFQWALSSTPAPIVQAVVAAAPLLTTAFAWGMGEGVPRVRFFAGAVLAVAGTATLFTPWWSWLVR